MSDGHLTDEQIFAAVLGEQAAHGHLGSCTHCRRQVEEMRAGIGAFRASADSWSRKTTVMSPMPRRTASRWSPYALVAGASAAVILAGAIAIEIAAPHPRPVKPAIAAADSADQIGADNALLKNVELALDSQPNVSVPMTEQSSREPRSSERRN